MNDKAFWDKVEIKNEDGCWEWRGSVGNTGYGRLFLNNKYIRAHRYALFLATGVMPDGMMALHSCDNTICVNPNHLRWGNSIDNSKDKVSRNRQLKGEESPVSKFKNDFIDRILFLRVSGESLNSTAKILGVEPNSILNVFLGRTWKHRHGVDGNPTLQEIKNSKPKLKQRKERNDAIVTHEIKEQILTLKSHGMGCTEISKKLRIPRTNVSQIFYRKK